MGKKKKKGRKVGDETRARRLKARNITKKCPQRKARRIYYDNQIHTGLTGVVLPSGHIAAALGTPEKRFIQTGRRERKGNGALRTGEGVQGKIWGNTQLIV